MTLPCRAALFVSAALAAAAVACTKAGSEAPAAPGGLAVVELFTSQGCSSCPPANANVAALSARPDVLALSFGVTYWDQLGWKDTFARPEFTERQRVYDRKLHGGGPFTPQVVVDGRADVVGADRNAIERLIGSQKLDGRPSLQVSAGAINLGPGPAPPGGADVWLVRYDPRTIEVPVARGENSGRTLPHKNVVRALVRLGAWTGRAERLALPMGDASLKSAVLVQTGAGGPILTALRF
jgi:hypothetical protein